jgi:hypothetical protein
VAVLDEAWLAVWWPWLLVWGVTAAMIAASVVVVVRHRKDDTSWRRNDICIYLDEGAIMDLHRRRRYSDALSREVVKTVKRSRRLSAMASFAPLQSEAERGVTTEVFQTYVEKDTPISVISLVLEVLDDADDVVEVDLARNEVLATAAFTKAFRGRTRARTVRLGELATYLLISGDFRETDEAAEAITFRAPFGTPDGAAGGPQVRIVCPLDGMRPGALSRISRCLGRVQRWDAATSTLEVRPIAAFH